jgi:hypothetical protein
MQCARAEYPVRNTEQNRAVFDDKMVAMLAAIFVARAYHAT